VRTPGEAGRTANNKNPLGDIQSHEQRNIATFVCENKETWLKIEKTKEF
jgi:hypothetical protein